MSYYPWSIQNALDNRRVLGKAAVLEYWTEYMSTRQRNAADLWIMDNRPDVLKRCAQGPQAWRFENLIEAIYAENSSNRNQDTY